MVIDTSALLAILLNEPEAVSFAAAMEGDSVRLLSAVSLLEAAMVMESRKGDPGGRELDILLHRGHLDVVPFDAEQAETARAAFRRYGRRRHPAGLNFGDCCAYALSITAHEPLLFKGDDFSKTDVARCSA